MSRLFFSSRRRHTRWPRDWSSDVCSSDLLLHNESVNARERFLDKFLIKPVQANAEQEWRCFRHATDEPSSKQPDDRLWYDDHPFERAEVGAVYFGAFMDIEDKQKLLSILREHYSEATVFEAEPIPGKYDIAFTRIPLT